MYIEIANEQTDKADPDNNQAARTAARRALEDICAANGWDIRVPLVRCFHSEMGKEPAFDVRGSVVNEMPSSRMGDIYFEFETWRQAADILTQRLAEQIRSRSMTLEAKRAQYVQALAEIDAEISRIKNATLKREHEVTEPTLEAVIPVQVDGVEHLTNWRIPAEVIAEMYAQRHAKQHSPEGWSNYTDPVYTKIFNTAKEKALQSDDILLNQVEKLSWEQVKEFAVCLGDIAQPSVVRDLSWQGAYKRILRLF